MNFKQTIIFAGIFILLAGYVYFFHINKPEEELRQPPEVWSVIEEDIEHIKVRLPRQDKQISFSLDRKKEKWHIDDKEKTPVFMKRWGGIVLLVSGPQSKKLLAEKVEDLKQFGLSDPPMVITLGVRGLKDSLDIIFGERTPQKDQFYVKMRHSDRVYLINDTFTEVLMRLANEPPIPPLIKAKREAQDS